MATMANGRVSPTRHQILKFPYNVKTKRYNVNLMNKNQSEPKDFGAFICD